RSASGGHHTIEFAHDVHANLEGTPLLALDKERLAARLSRFRQYEINAPIRTATSRFDYLVALQAKSFTHEHLELAPAHSIERAGYAALRDIDDELLPGPSSPCRHPGAEQTGDRHDELSDASERLPNCLSGHCASLPQIGGGDD